MAEDKKDEKKDGEGAEAAPAPAKKSNKMLFIVIGAVVFLLIAIGVPVTILMVKSKAHTTESELSADAAKGGPQGELEGAKDEEELQEGEEPLGAIFPLETFVVNLNGTKYIRCQIQFEFVSRDVPKKFYGRLVPLRDAIISLLTSKTAEDIGSVKGKEGLRSEIKDLVNETLKKEDVKHVYFTQFVIQ